MVETKNISSKFLKKKVVFFNNALGKNSSLVEASRNFVENSWFYRIQVFYDEIY